MAQLPDRADPGYGPLDQDQGYALMGIQRRDLPFDPPVVTDGQVGNRTDLFTRAAAEAVMQIL